MSSSDGKGTENFHNLQETIQRTSLICYKRYKKLPSSARKNTENFHHLLENKKKCHHLIEKVQKTSITC